MLLPRNVFLSSVLLFFSEINFSLAVTIPLQDATNKSSGDGSVQFFLGRKLEDGKFGQTEIVLNDDTSLKTSGFNSDAKKTVILIHGFWHHDAIPFPRMVRNAYLSKMDPSPAIPSINVITADWASLSRPLLPEVPLTLFENGIYPLLYPLVVGKNVPLVANRVNSFINFLVKSGKISGSSIHLIGHSLGAHISGLAAGVKNPVRVGRITGLDPAGPFFDSPKGGNLGRKLKKEDADFVDIYHCAMGTRGLSEGSSIGHVDFYPNGGKIQPGCPMDLSASTYFATDPFGKGTCSHEFVINIYSATVIKDLEACQCFSLIQDGEKLSNCMVSCPQKILAGEKCPKEARGLYYFETGEVP